MLKTTMFRLSEHRVPSLRAGPPSESHVTLPTNGALFVREGLGFLLSFEGLVDTGETSPLTCRPLDPPLTARSYLIRRKNATVTPIAERFLTVLRELVSPRESRR